MVLVLSPQTMLLGEGVKFLMAQAAMRPGEAIPIPPELAAGLEQRLVAQASSRVLDIRKRERNSCPDLLARHLG